MSIPLPESALDAPGQCPAPRWGTAALTRLALSQALRELTDMSLTLIPTFGEDGLRPGTYSAAMRRVGVLYKRARILAALSDRIILGASWSEIDKHLGLPPGQAEAVYEAMEARWRRGDTAPWAPVFDAVDDACGAYETAGQVYGYPIDLSDPDRLAADLDRYSNRHLQRERRDRTRFWNDPRKPVSEGLPR